jgi:hypothetical protein
VPTLVIHGLADRMCDASGGRATAEAIPGAELLLTEGVGPASPGLCGARKAVKHTVGRCKDTQNSPICGCERARPGGAIEICP